MQEKCYAPNLVIKNEALHGATDADYRDPDRPAARTEPESLADSLGRTPSAAAVGPGST